MGRLYLVIAFILAGSSVIVARFVSMYLPPFSTTFFSLVFASLTALLFGGRKMFKTAKRLSGKVWLVILLQAIFGSFLFRVFLTAGLRHIGAAEAGIITGTTPTITALFTWVILREQFSGRTVAGILLTCAGIMILQGFPFELSLEYMHMRGVILIVCAAACEALFTTLSRKIHMDSQEEKLLSPLVHAGFVSILAMMLCLVPALMEQPWAAVNNLPISGWLALLWYGSIVTVVAFACMFAGAKRCNGYTIAAFSGVIPISSTFLSVIILKEPINPYQLIGCACVILATLVISRQKAQDGQQVKGTT